MSARPQDDAPLSGHVSENVDGLRISISVHVQQGRLDREVGRAMQHSTQRTPAGQASLRVAIEEAHAALHHALRGVADQAREEVADVLHALQLDLSRAEGTAAEARPPSSDPDHEF